MSSWNVHWLYSYSIYLVHSIYFSIFKILSLKSWPAKNALRMSSMATVVSHVYVNLFEKATRSLSKVIIGVSINGGEKYVMPNFCYEIGRYPISPPPFFGRFKLIFAVGSVVTNSVIRWNETLLRIRFIVDGHLEMDFILALIVFSTLFFIVLLFFAYNLIFCVEWFFFLICFLSPSYTVCPYICDDGAMETGFPSYRCGGDDVGKKKENEDDICCRCSMCQFMARWLKELSASKKKSRVRRRTENFCLNGSPTHQLFSSMANFPSHSISAWSWSGNAARGEGKCLNRSRSALRV